MKHISKAFILGAGLGTRLRPLTDRLPKPLVPLYHEPMVNYALRHCLTAGIKEFAVNTHHAAEAWDTAYPDSLFEGARMSFFFEKILLETGGGIKNIESFIGDEPLLIYNGDILTDLDVEGLMAAHLESGDVATLALFDHGPNCNVGVSGDRVVDMRNARGINAGTHQFSGIYCINPEILELIPAAEKISIVPALLALAESGKLGAYVCEGAKWHDLGTRESYFEAHHLLRSNSEAISPKAEIATSAKVCRETCVIGAGAKIGANAELKHTIVWPGAVVAEGAELSQCIVRETASGRHDGKDL